MFKLLLLLVAQPHFVDCACQCVDGVPKTLCQTIAEARQQLRLCSPRLRCPIAEQAEPTAAEPEPPFLDAPDEGAHSCREIRVWDTQRGVYDGVRVCDVFTS